MDVKQLRCIRVCQCAEANSHINDIYRNKSSCLKKLGNRSVVQNQKCLLASAASFRDDELHYGMKRQTFLVLVYVLSTWVWAWVGGGIGQWNMLMWRPEHAFRGARHRCWVCNVGRNIISRHQHWNSACIHGHLHIIDGITNL